MNTAWMWLSGDELRGLSLDLENGNLRWHTEIGCDCDDEGVILQPIAAFQEEGIPLTIGRLPDDVAAELAETLAQRLATSL